MHRMYHRALISFHDSSCIFANQYFAKITSVFVCCFFFFFFSSRRRHTRCLSDWSSDVCSSDLNSASSGRIGFSPAGGDTDIAVAPSRNLNGFFNVYVASLATSPPLANVYVSTSKDGGNSWLLNPTGASIPVDDREWIAADGADKVCVSYHAISATNDIFVTCSLNGGTTFTQTGNAFDPAHLAFLDGVK